MEKINPAFPQLIFNLFYSCSSEFVFLWEKNLSCPNISFSPTLCPSTFHWRLRSLRCLRNKWVSPFSFIERLVLDFASETQTIACSPLFSVSMQFWLDFPQFHFPLSLELPFVERISFSTDLDTCYTSLTIILCIWNVRARYGLR